MFSKIFENFLIKYSGRQLSVTSSIADARDNSNVTNGLCSFTTESM